MAVTTRRRRNSTGAPSLQARLADAEEALRAIRSGEVDALVVSTPGGEALFTRHGADHSYRMLIEQMSEGALIVSAHGIVHYSNRRFAEMLGKPLEELVGSALHQWVGAEDTKACQALLRRDDGTSRRDAEVTLAAADGRRVPAKLSAFVLRTGDPREQFGLVASDLTEQRRAAETVRALNAGLEARIAERTAELHASNRELDSFCHAVSHDLRAPLRGVNGFALALLQDYEDKLDAEGRDALHRIRSASQRMGVLIDDLLRLSRSTCTELRLEHVDIAGMAREIAASLTLEQPDRRVSWAIDAVPAIRADAALMAIAMRNLLQNALKFTGKRDHAVIRFGSEERDGVRTYFVADDGVGFDMAYAGKLFGPFQRLHNVADFPGFGVGLAIVERIVRRHGGRVWAEAAPGKGATFFFTVG